MKQILLICAVVMGQSVLAADKKLIADPIVEKAIRRVLEKPEGELTKADLEKVTRLSLQYSKITDAGLKGVAKLQKLKTLILNGTKITAAGLKEIAKLENLINLYLGDKKITDTPATPAQGLMPSSETCIKIAKALREFDGEE